MNYFYDTFKKKKMNRRGTFILNTKSSALFCVFHYVLKNLFPLLFIPINFFFENFVIVYSYNLTYIYFK